MYRSIGLCCVMLAACGDGRLPSPPTLHDVSVTTAEDTPLTISVPLTAADQSAVHLTIVAVPSHGTLTGAGPSWTYTPALDYSGDDAVVVRAEDPYGTGMATVTIHVTAVDDAPVGNADSLAAGFETPLTVAQATLLANDTDLDSSTLTLTAVTAGTHGTVAVSGSNVVFTPEIGYTGMATFSYTVSDGAKTGQGTVTVSIGVDEAPVAVDDPAVTNEDAPLMIPDATLLANDTDVEHQTLAISAVGSASHGTVSHTGTQVTFTPDADYHGEASFDYTVTDGYKTDVGTVSVTVTSVNDVPVAVADSAATNEDTPLILAATLLAANDTDADLDTLTVTAVTATATTHGTVDLTSGSITYTPDANFHGTASFSYTVSDGNGGTDTGTVTVTVASINDVPVAVADAVSTDEDTPLTFPATQLAANDTDADLDALTVTAVTATATTHGTVVLTSGSITYTPATNYNGAADFGYTVSDGNGGTASGSVTVTVVSVNDAPVVTTAIGTATYVENAPALAVDPEVAVTDVDSATLVGATIQIAPGCTSPEDVLGAVLTPPNLRQVRQASIAPPPDPPSNITVVGYNPTTCTLTLSGAASVAEYQAALRLVTYTNTSDTPATTARTVVFTVNDGQAANNTGTASRALGVTAVNDVPVAVADAVSTDEDTPLTFPATQLSANDTDADLDTLTVTAVTATATTHGTVDLTSGSITYTPATNYNGAADFGYTVSDGNGGTASGTVTVTVVSVNDAPVVTASSGTAAYTENAPALPVDPGIVVTDADSATLVGATIQITPGCTSPEDILGVVLTPPDLRQVRPASIAPPIPPSNITVNGYNAATCTLTLTGAASPAEYQAALRLVTYTNTSDAPATAARAVVFTVDDGQAASNIGTASRGLGVTAVDDGPVAVHDIATVVEDSSANPIDVLANDTDVDGGAKSIASVTQPARGTVVITGGGTGVTYQPNANFCNALPPPPLLALFGGGGTNGPAAGETFTYTLTPGGSTATVTVSVTCVDDPPTAVNDTVTVAEDSGSNTLNVLANDTDIDGGSDAITSVTQPSHGAAALGINGLSVLYTPTPGYCNQIPNGVRDTFTYTLTPGGSSATVSVTVSCACGQNKPTDFVVGSNN